MQIYLNHCESASHDLLTTLRRLRVDIVLIHKLWILKDKILGFSGSGYSLLVPKISQKVTTCILARSKLDLLITSCFCTGDITTVTLGSR